MLIKIKIKYDLQTNLIRNYSNSYQYELFHDIIKRFSINFSLNKIVNTNGIFPKIKKPSLVPYRLLPLG